MFNLKNRTVLVSGCNGYIGKSICKSFIKLGAKVIGTDIKNDKKNSKLHSFYKLDLSSKNEISNFIKLLDKKVTKLDVLVNNAGYVAASGIDKKTSEKYEYNQKYEELNLSNTIFFTNSLISKLKKSKSASIINICSIYSYLAYDYRLYKQTNMKTPLAYGISKAGLMHYSKMLSTALAPKIRVNAISPGGIFRNQSKKFIRRYLKKTPLNRMCTEEDVANAAVFFSSDLSNYITGQNLIIDGGYSSS